MLSNSEIARMLTEIKQSCEAEKHGGQMHFARLKMVEMGFFDSMPESGLNPFRPCPEDWTALQVSLFDNGVPPKARRRRNYVERTKVQYAAQIKVWQRDKIDFRNKSQISWRANCYLWDVETAKQVAVELLAQKYIDQNTVDLVNTVCDQMDSEEWLVSIPMLKTKEAGTHWMKEHIVAIQIVDGEAKRFVFYNQQLSVSGDSWSEVDAGGKDLDDNVMGQIRLGRNAGFDTWATQPAS